MVWKAVEGFWKELFDLRIKPPNVAKGIQQIYGMIKTRNRHIGYRPHSSGWRPSLLGWRPEMD